MKKIVIFSLRIIIVFLVVYVFCTFLLQSCSPDVNTVDEYTTITDFEKNSKLKYYNLYDFDIFYKNNQKKLLKDEEIILTFDNEYKQKYMITTTSSKIQYKVDYGLENMGEQDYQIENMNGVTIYGYTYDNEQKCSFIVRYNDFQYSIEGVENHDFQDCMNKIKDYVKLNESMN